MTPARPLHPARHSCPGGLFRLLLAAALGSNLPGAAEAQSAPARGERVSVLVAADETRLWLASVASDRSELFLRESAGRFNLGQPVNAPISLLTVYGPEAALIFRDGQLFSANAQQRRVAKLRTAPGSAVPLALINDGDTLLALARRTEATSQPQEGGAAGEFADQAERELSIYQLTKDGWTLLGECPTDARRRDSGAAPPRLLADGALLLLAYEPADRPGQLTTMRLEPSARSWQPLAGALEVPNLTRFWLASVGNVPTLTAAQRDRDGTERIAAFRLLGNLSSGLREWQPATLHLGELPAGARPTHVHSAFGFNQHLGFLVADDEGAAYLQFARFDGPAIEPTVDVAEVLKRPGVVQQTQQMTQMVSFLVLLLLLAGLFTLRRDSMRQITGLPAGQAIAFSFQRLTGWAVDFAPVLLITAAWMNVDWRAGLTTLANWAISPSPEHDGPQREVLIWWACSVLAYTTYTTIVELLTARTLGKLVARSRVCDERGSRPAAWQILVRNSFRLLELAPQFWVFQLLLLLSPNRQRLGDIFARTLVVRRTTLTGEPQAVGREPGSDEPPDA